MQLSLQVFMVLHSVVHMKSDRNSRVKNENRAWKSSSKSPHFHATAGADVWIVGFGKFQKCTQGIKEAASGAVHDQESTSFEAFRPLYSTATISLDTA